MLRSIYVKLYRAGVALFGGLGLHKVWPFGPIHDYLSARARGYKTPEYIFIFDSKLYLVPGDNMGLSIWGEDYERATTDVVRAKLRPGDVFVDVGANIGFFTVLAAKLVGPSGNVYAFEPDPANFALLQKNVAANGYTNVICEQTALSDAPGTISFFLSAHNAGDHAMYDRQSELRKMETAGTVNPKGVYDQHSAADPRTKITVQAVTLDDYIASHGGRADFIKIDVQGGEKKVLDGAQETLKKTSTVKLTTEFWPAGLTLAGSDPDRYLRTFEELGFGFSLIEKGGRAPVSREQLLKDYTVYNNHTAELYIERRKIA